MSEDFFPIPGSVNEDKIVLFMRRHWISFAGQMFLSIILVLIPIVLVLIIDKAKSGLIHGAVLNFLVVGLSIYYLVIVTFIFTAWLSYYYNLYVITVDEIIEVTQVGFFGRKISEVSLLRVQDVSSNVQGFFETIFGYGDVLVESAGEQSQHYVIRSVARPHQICSKIMALHDAILDNKGRREEAEEGEGMLRVHRSQENSNLPPVSSVIPEETPYRKLIREQSSEYQPVPPQKDSAPPAAAPAEKSTEPPPAAPSPPGSKTSSQEGEFDSDHLKEGGTIDLS